MLADGTGEVVGQFLTHVLVATDGAAPDGLALCGLTHGLGLRLDVLLIIIIGGRGHVGEHFHLGDGAYEKHVRAKVDGLLHVGRDKGIGATGDGQCAVGAQSRKKVEIAPTLRFLIGLFYFIHQFLALAEVEDILEGGEGNVMHGLTGEECLMGGNDDVGHHQEQGQLVIVNHLV